MSPNLTAIFLSLKLKGNEIIHENLSKSVIDRHFRQIDIESAKITLKA